MRILCFSLSNQWKEVVKFFKNRYIKNSNDKGNYYDLDGILITWLAYRIVHKTDSIDTYALDYPLPFDIEMDFYHNSDDLIASSPELSKFEDVLDLLYLEDYHFNEYIEINLDSINNLMVITER